jgi:uncharacterized protein (DUF4415 family)
MKSKKIDFSEIPELSDKQLSRMRRVGRPTVGDEPRKLIAIRLDAKVLSWLRKTAAKKGTPYQSLDKCQYLSVGVDANTSMSVESVAFE